MPYFTTSTLRPNTRMSLRPVTAPAGNVLDNYRRMNADFSDLDFDSFPEAIIGTYGGGLLLMKGEYLPNDLSTFEIAEPLSVNIYPNPTDGRIRIVLDEQGEAQYELYDLNGRMHLSGIIQSDSDIDLSGFAPGLYVIRVVQEDRARHAKIIKR